MANISFLPNHLHHDPDDASALSSHHQHYHRHSNHRIPPPEPYFPIFPPSSSSSDPYHPLTQPNNFNIIHEEDAVSDPESVILGGPDLLDRENQVNFVMDLFQQRVEQSGRHHDPTSHLVTDSLNESDFGVIDDNCELGIDQLEFELGLGFGLENCAFQHINNFNSETDNNNNDVNCPLAILNDDEEDDFFIERRVSGLQSCEAESTLSFASNSVRVVGFASDSDLEDIDNNHFAIDLNSAVDDYGLELDRLNLGNDRISLENFDNYGDEEEDMSVSIPLFWDSLQLEDHLENNEDFEWEEVDGSVDEREVLNMFNGNEEVASVTLSISPIIAPDDMVNVERGGLGNLEWEVLLNANNLDVNPEHEHDDHNGEPYFGDHDDYIYTAEYEMLFGQFAENENALIGRPPAAKSVVDRLPSVVLTKVDVDNNDALCAVCKDEMNVGEQAKQLPCTHRYHGECILPWLGIRNTCPVCRFELPTDDAEYERRKAAQRAIAATRRH